MSDTQAPLSVPYAACLLGQLARDIPGATGVFRRHHLDFCCGGGATLETAARARQLDVRAIELELAILDLKTPSDIPKGTVELIDHIMNRFHEVHRRELPELTILSHKVEHVHMGHPDVPAGLSELLERMLEEIKRHMHMEEQILFPMMRAHPDSSLVPPVKQMRAEHDEHGRTLTRIDELTQGLQTPTDACATWRALYTGLDKLIGDLMEHIHIENNILFPRFESHC